MNLGLILLAWAAIIVVAICCILGSGLVSVEIIKEDPEEKKGRSPIRFDVTFEDDFGDDSGEDSTGGLSEEDSADDEAGNEEPGEE